MTQKGALSFDSVWQMDGHTGAGTGPRDSVPAGDQDAEDIVGQGGRPDKPWELSQAGPARKVFSFKWTKRTALRPQTHNVRHIQEAAGQDHSKIMQQKIKLRTRIINSN